MHILKCKVCLHMSACLKICVSDRAKHFLPAKFRHLSVKSDFDEYMEPL